MKKKSTCLPKHPFPVEAIYEKDRRLCESHEEITDGQVHDEIVWQVAKLLVAAKTHKRVTHVALSTNILYSNVVNDKLLFMRRLNVFRIFTINKSMVSILVL